MSNKRKRVEKSIFKKILIKQALNFIKNSEILLSNSICNMYWVVFSCQIIVSIWLTYCIGELFVFLIILLQQIFHVYWILNIKCFSFHDLFYRRSHIKRLR
jgi:hypothetical protein